MSGRTGFRSFLILFNRTCASFTHVRNVFWSAMVKFWVTHPLAAIAGVAGAATMPPVTSIATAATQTPGRIASTSRLIDHPPSMPPKNREHCYHGFRAAATNERGWPQCARRAVAVGARAAGAASPALPRIDGQQRSAGQPRLQVQVAVHGQLEAAARVDVRPEQRRQCPPIEVAEAVSPARLVPAGAAA